MGLSCLFGHDFADPTHREERERHGEEVVLTTRNVETCRRCGTERVLAENTAVMKREAVRDGSEADGPMSESADETDDGEPTTDDAETATGTRTPGGRDTSASAVGPDDIGSETETGDGPPVTDDAVILTDGSRETRRPMEWPDFGGAGEGSGRSSSAGDGDFPGTDDGNSSGVRFGTTRDAPELRCEGCDTTWDPTAASLLAGDLCPNCRMAYLTDGS
jgi:hypothetical protein